MGELPKEKRIYIYCYNIVCFRATHAARELARNDYTKLTELIGGFEEWQKRGHPVET